MQGQSTEHSCSLQQQSDIQGVLLGAAQIDQSVLMLVTAHTHCNSWLCALAASPLRDNNGILSPLSKPCLSNLKVTACAYSLPLSTLIHPVGYFPHLPLSLLQSNCQFSLTLASFYLLPATVFQVDSDKCSSLTQCCPWRRVLSGTRTTCSVSPIHF